MASLVEQRNELKAKIDQIAEEIQQFRMHLASDKFIGTEPVKHVCPRCEWDDYPEERKDWIATSDVDRWLSGLESIVRD